MRFLIVLAMLAVLAVVVVLVVYAVRGRPAAARWETHTVSAGGVTTVAVRQLTGERETGRQTIAEIPDDDADWEARYHEAMAQARSRVAALESQRD
ncbi:hypothetical protein [Actinomadura macrotermitis]|uniref:Uncharacterized protein n=1 Tax=Actinomadura macrotermitis TaxID=2585200 RepID=A0A7K0C1R6_9ACTN|nr:hypothetical protein [Actinomadura macrotermitis]MQY07369.1 hypothetical protein [Actinomadura macrotermitis]